MDGDSSTKITVKVEVHTSIEKVWENWTEPKHIIEWNNASEDWHTLTCENDLRDGGKFCSRMEAKDGSFGFDFWGTYNEVILHKFISYTLGDGRRVNITFTGTECGTAITEVFESENTHSIEQQQQGWQAILNNFKKCVEK